MNEVKKITASGLGPITLALFVVLTLLLVSCGDDSQPTSQAATADSPTSPYPEPGIEPDTSETRAGYPSPADRTDSGSPSPGYPGPDFADDITPDAVKPIPQFPGKIAFHSQRSGSLQIYTMDGATGTVDLFVQTPTQAFEPSWAPDCRALLFTAGPGGQEGFDLYTISDVGQDIRPLAAEEGLLEWAGAWSPAGDVIAYQNNRDNLINVCFVDPLGSDLGCLERDSFSNAMPAWSPDGTKLAFGSNRDGDWDLFLTEYPPTGEITRLSDNSGIDFYPEFSPNGELVVFASERLGNFEIIIVNADGTGERQLTEELEDDTTPAWVGENQIVFSSVRTQDWELYLMNADGSEIKRLTYQENIDQWPIWCSTG
jgi:Tol biopolymer transport system component